MPTGKAGFSEMAGCEITQNFDIEGVQLAARQGVYKALRDCGFHAQREAKRNAPRSPTMKQRSRTLVRRKRMRQQANPGGLERSISFEFYGDRACIFVAENSEARNKKSGFNYAKRIHDEKGKKWFKRGAGTVAKGARADEKFIERAISDNRKKYDLKLKKAIEKALKTGGKK